MKSHYLFLYTVLQRCFIDVSAALQHDLLAKPYYDLQFSNDRLTSKEVTSLRNEVQSVIKYKVLHDGRNKYLCAVPNVTLVREILSTDEKLRLAEQKKEESVRATARGKELLSGIDATCLYWMSGWWTYRFCYSDGITQFHPLPPIAGTPNWPPREDVNAGIYSLGTRATDSANDKNRDLAVKFRSTDDSKSLVMTYERGTFCPVIGAERRTEVQFQCSPSTNDHIAYVKEVSSCQYLMVVRTARLCHDIAFQESAKEPSNTVLCSMISEAYPHPGVEELVLPKLGEADDRLTSDESQLHDIPETTGGDPKPDDSLAHLSFDQIPESWSKFVKEDEPSVDNQEQSSTQARQTGDPVNDPSRAEELASNIAEQLKDGTVKVDGKSIFDATHENVEFDVELQDENGELLGSVVMKVVDGQVMIEMEDDSSAGHDSQESVDDQNQRARENIPAHVQATFDRFVGRDEL